ncbi:unnamed protein product [Camellia sinensis]
MVRKGIQSEGKRKEVVIQSIAKCKTEIKKKRVRKGEAFGSKIDKWSMLQAALATISCSKSQASSSIRVRYLLNEAQATMQIGKLLGIDFKEKENEVLDKLMDLERKDLERAEAIKGSANKP